MVMDDFGVTSLGVPQSFCDATPARQGAPAGGGAMGRNRSQPSERVIAGECQCRRALEVEVVTHDAQDLVRITGVNALGSRDRRRRTRGPCRGRRALLRDRWFREST